MADEATEFRQVGELRLDDESMLVFATYSLGSRRLGSARIYREAARYAGPTRAGFDMQLPQLEQLIPILEQLSHDLEAGAVVPPTEVARIPTGTANEWVVSVLEPDGRRDEAALDIRKFVSSKKYTGWTRKGLRLGVQRLDDMIPLLAALRDDLRAWRGGRSGRFAEVGSSGAEADDVIQQPPSAVPPEYRDLF